MILKLARSGFTIMKQVFLGELPIKEREGLRDNHAGEILEHCKKVNIKAHMRKQKETRKAAIDFGTHNAEVINL